MLLCFTFSEDFPSQSHSKALRSICDLPLPPSHTLYTSPIFISIPASCLLTLPSTTLSMPVHWCFLCLEHSSQMFTWLIPLPLSSFCLNARCLGLPWNLHVVNFKLPPPCFLAPPSHFPTLFFPYTYHLLHTM